MGGSEVWVVMVLVCVAGSGGVCGWCVWGGEDEGVFGHEHKARPGRSHTRSHQARQASHPLTPCLSVSLGHGRLPAPPVPHTVAGSNRQ